jgi:hypothetical protein
VPAKAFSLSGRLRVMVVTASRVAVSIMHDRVRRA